jgi:hypothetical protein
MEAMGGLAAVGLASKPATAGAVVGECTAAGAAHAASKLTARSAARFTGRVPL